MANGNNTCSLRGKCEAGNSWRYVRAYTSQGGSNYLLKNKSKHFFSLDFNEACQQTLRLEDFFHIFISEVEVP